MMIIKKIAFLVTAVFVVTLTSCTTTKLTGSFKDESLAGKKFKHILIIGAARQPEIRIQFEEEFVRQLQAQKVIAVPSYLILSAEQVLNRDVISAKISELAMDAVLVTRLTELKKKREAYRGNTYRTPYAYYNQMHEYYKKGFEESAGQSPLTTHKIISLETNIYSAETEKLVWATASDVQVQDKVSKLTEDFVKAVVNKLVRDNVI